MVSDIIMQRQSVFVKYRIQNLAVSPQDFGACVYEEI